jgi:hypothetical protein
LALCPQRIKDGRRKNRNTQRKKRRKKKKRKQRTNGRISYYKIILQTANYLIEVTNV